VPKIGSALSLVDQEVYSGISVCCVGRAGITPHIAPTLYAKVSVGLRSSIAIPSSQHLNRQLFYQRDNWRPLRRGRWQQTFKRSALPQLRFSGHALPWSKQLTRS